MYGRPGMTAWLLQRITAVVILVGLTVHFIYFHWLVGDGPITVDEVRRVAGGHGWIVFNSILLFACLYHLFYGIYGILGDFNPPKGFKTFVLYAFWIIGVGMSLFGVYTLIAMRTVDASESALRLIIGGVL